jgi:diaminopimelate epimerase
MKQIKYLKYHALGNDYIVIRPDNLRDNLSKNMIRIICHRNYGIGSDGILLGPFESDSCDFSLKIFNPDGSEAEKSGNGLRIFARSLCDDKLTASNTFTIETLGGRVSCDVSPDRKTVKVEMGQVSFNSILIPVNGKPRDVLNETIYIDGKELKFCAATVGNPHCVIFSDNPSPEEAKLYGPKIENDPIFPNRTNVQFLKVLDRSNIKIEIWERGAGYTLASGSSSTAAAAVSYKLGLCDSKITTHMPGGQIEISFNTSFMATITGPVTKICSGTIEDEIFETKL